MMRDNDGTGVPADVQPGEGSSSGDSPGAAAPSPPAAKLADVSLEELLAMPVGEALRLLLGRPAKPPRPAPLDLEAARELGRQNAREQLRRMRRGRV